MHSSELISGEHLDHKLAAIFESAADAQTSADWLTEESSLTREQVIVINPKDRHPGVELEPEDNGIWKTLVRAHLWLGAVGFAGGILLFLLLYWIGVAFVTNNAITALVVLSVFGAVFGLLGGGLATIRPDHSPYLVKAQSALRRGKTVLAVHARSHQQLQEAQRILHSRHVETIATL